MKKFLFTLAALMMAGSAFATNDYCYIEDFYVTADQLGQEIDVPLKAHIEGILNAWDVTINYPEGITGVWAEDGEDMAFTYFNARGVEKTGAGTWAWNEDEGFTHGVAITGATIKSYQNVDGEWVYSGAPKWEPGEYEEVAILTILIDPSFDITKPVKFNIVSIPACGEDVRPNHSTGETATYVVTVNPEDTPTPEVFTATPSVVFAGNVATLTYTSNDADAVATVTVNGVETAVEWNNGTATYTVTEGTEVGTHNVVVALSVAPGPDGSHAGDAVSANDTYTYTVKPNFVANPTITFDANGVATLSMNANDPNATAVVTVDGTEVNVAFENGVATLPLTLSTEVGDHSIVVAMTVSPSADYEGEAVPVSATYTYTVDPTIVDAEVPNITFTPNEAGVEVNITNYTEYTIKVNGAQVDPTRALPYQVDKGYEAKTIEVWAKNNPGTGYNPKEDTKTYNLEAKAPEASTPATAGEPTMDANNIYVPITGNVTSITVDGQPAVLDVNGNLVLPRAEQAYTPEIVIVTNDAHDNIPYTDATATIDNITVPAWVTVPAIELVEGNSNGHWVDSYVDDQGNPVWGHMEYDETGHNMVVNFSTTYEDAILYWQILNEDGEIIQSGNTEDQTASSQPIYENGNYTAVAWVVLPNDESRRNTRDFEIDDMTNVNELVNGKTVANVRYFNVAGQEMQEANGMTIVVTTYTDGTTSTVKVMK